MEINSKSRDWRRESIIAALHGRQITLAGLSEKAGYERSAASVALSRRWPAVECLIARAIGKCPREIWPSRYADDGKASTHHHTITAQGVGNVERPGAPTQ